MWLALKIRWSYAVKTLLRRRQHFEEDGNGVMRWRYFGRTSGSGVIHELYRCPANGMAFLDQPAGAIQRLRKNGTWASDPIGEQAVANERVTGWFNEETDELKEQEALQLIDNWKRESWPGRH